MAEMIAAGAWWDYVDAVATRPLGERLARQPAAMRRTLRAWAKGESLWQRRAAILAQLSFKARTDPRWVRAYVEEHRARLAPLSIREALLRIGAAQASPAASPPSERAPRAAPGGPGRRSSPR